MGGVGDVVGLLGDVVYVGVGGIVVYCGDVVFVEVFDEVFEGFE